MKYPPCGWLFLLAIVFAGSSLQSDDKIDFAKQILPILSDKCFVCHGPDSDAENELRLDTPDFAYADLGGYRAIDQKNPGESEVLKRILSEDDPMPPEDHEKQLSAKEKSLLSKWIGQGGNYQKHWAYVVPQKVTPRSEPKAKGYVAIDAFIADGFSEEVAFADPAEKSVLARRTALTLIGLPPEPKLLTSFLEDDQPEAFSRYVDQLLADPRYGEHQARFWLDAVRYGDTHGLHLDNKRGIFPYRDWVVQAFNRNQPFDEFITWQLAGDLLPNPGLEQLVATGFVRMNPSTSEGGAIPAEFQAKNNFDRTENLGTVFLGMSLVCARCHTHKYDPIPQQDYYELLAFFNSTAEPAMDGNRYEYGPTVKAPRNQKQWSDYRQLEQESKQIVQLATDFLATVRLAENDDSRAWNAAGSNVLKKIELVAKPLPFFADKEFVVKAQAWLKKKQLLDKGFTTTLVAKELAKPRATRLLVRGEYNQPAGEKLAPDVVSVVGELAEKAPRNRLGLAQWLTSRKNPLTSRVLVNRIWQRVFGHGLVRTPEEFGAQGEQPTHPELLDWLAVEFQESGWNVKHLLKMMVMTRTFRQSSAWRNDVDDPENKMFARGPAYRLDAEVLRDLVLWASGLMVDEQGGEGVKPYQPAGMWKALAHPASNTKQYVRDKGEKLYRRSLYVYWKRTSPHPMMTLFDAPSRESSCVRRSRTNTSLQSLGLFNETQRIELSRKLAERLIREQRNDQKRLTQLYLVLTSRAPSETENRICMQLLNQMKARYSDSASDAEKLLSTGDAPGDKSLKPAEVAAWTQVVVTVLASDAALQLY